MKDGVRVLVLADLIFVALLSLSGSVRGVLGDIVYYLAFLGPLAVGIYGAKRLKKSREEQKGLAELTPSYFKLNRKSAIRFLPFIFPVVALTLLISLFTSLVMGLFGFTPPEVPVTSLFEMLLIHALIPAFTEELVFRLLPLLLLLPYSPRYCVIISSLTFALCHVDIFKLPYAFAAGLALIFVDVAVGSVIPSIILHFVNNAVSVLLLATDESFTLPLIVTLVLLSLVSLAFIFVRRNDHKKDFREAMKRGEGFAGGREIGAITALCLFVSLTALL